MENFALVTLVEELKKATEGMVVRRVVAHRPGGFLLQTRAVKIPALKISLDARNPALYVSGNQPPVGAIATDFLLSLRKHLHSAHLINVEKPLSERIVELTFKTALPAKELETVTLVAELFPNAPNLLILDQSRNILDWYLTPSPRRLLAQYGEYRYPNIDKLDLNVVLGEDRTWFDEVAFRKNPQSWLIRTIAGIGPVFAAEIAHRQTSWERPPIEEMAQLIRRLSTTSSTAWVYSERPLSNILSNNDLDALRRAIVTPIELESLEGKGAQTYPNLLEATRIVSDEVESRTLLERAKAPTRRQMRDQIRRLENQRLRLLERRQKYLEATQLQRTAQLLVSSGRDMDRRQESIELTDYFAEIPETRTVPLDPTKTLRDNVSKMFKQHQKAQRGTRFVEDQLLELKTVERRLQADLSHLGSIGNWNAWLAFSGAKPGKSDARATPHGRRRPSRKRRLIQIDGHEVLVGRNGRENDELTFKVAAGDDFWFHVADYTGSHVIVRNPTRQTELEQGLLLRAAELAAYYSQARNSPKVEVHYTRRKFVTKPRKAKPGLVTLREFRTITVEPRGWPESEHNARETPSQENWEPDRNVDTGGGRGVEPR